MALNDDIDPEVCPTGNTMVMVLTPALVPVLGALMIAEYNPAVRPLEFAVTVNVWLFPDVTGLDIPNQIPAPEPGAAVPKLTPPTAWMEKVCCWTVELPAATLGKT
jgi:hypothetical protein